MKKLIDHIRKDQLYRNSIYLMLNTIVTTGFGFFFWMICARLFTTEQVGYATTIISAIGLVSSLSFLGLNTALIRYLPKAKDKARLIGSCLNLTGLVSIVASIIFLVLIPVLSPKLLFVIESKILLGMFIAFNLLWVIYMMVDPIFISSRRSKLVLIKSAIFGVGKLVLPFLLVFLGTFGILSTYYISALISCIFAFFYFKYLFVIDFSLIKKMFVFSAGNYFAGIFMMLPNLVLPIIITNIIGPEPTAYFYVTLMIAGLLFIIPGAVSQSLLTEGSHNSNNLNKKIKKAFKFSYLLLVPCAIFVFLLGKYLLLLFGKAYSENGTALLQILAISSLFFAVNIIYISIKNVQHKVKTVAIIGFLMSGTILALSFWLLSFGLIGAGIAWLIGQIVANCFVLFDYIKSRREHDA